MPKTRVDAKENTTHLIFTHIYKAYHPIVTKPTHILDLNRLQNGDWLRPIHSKMVALQMKEGLCCELFSVWIQILIHSLSRYVVLWSALPEPWLSYM